MDEKLINIIIIQYEWTFRRYLGCTGDTYNKAPKSELGETKYLREQVTSDISV